VLEAVTAKRILPRRAALDLGDRASQAGDDLWRFARS
jgi:hypothetical protein